MAEFGGQLGEGQHVANSTMEVNEDRARVDVTIDGIPDTAADFRACMRVALQDMPIADEPFRQGVETLNYRRQEALAEQRNLVGHPVVLVVEGVTIVVGEVALEAGAITVLFVVTVTVIDKAEKDVAEKIEEEGFKAKCAAHYATCMATAFAGKRGNHKKQSRCGICARVCVKTEVWPSAVGNGSCEYWQRNWR
jgi:hypothetical protein